MNEIETASLQKSDLFRMLDRNSLEAVIQGGTSRSLREGASLLKQGDEPDHLFIVTQGRFKMTTLSNEGTQKTLRFMEPGDLIGCAAVFRRIPYPATATATTNSVVLTWTAQQFDQLLRRYPQLAANALAVVGGRAEEMLQRLREVTTESVDQRIAHALLRLVKQAGLNAPSEGQIVLRMSRQDIAELSDTTLFTVSRTISTWKRAGIVDAGRGRVSVRDLKRLSQIAQNVNALR